MEKDRERWMLLCEQAASEQDPDRLMELIGEINRLLDAEERRLKGSPPASEPTG